MNPETKIENEYCEWLRTEFPLPALALKLVLLPAKGFPDRTILAKGQVFFIEFKRPGASLAPLQKKWQQILVALGFKYYVCTSCEQACRITTKVLRG